MNRNLITALCIAVGMIAAGSGCTDQSVSAIGVSNKQSIGTMACTGHSKNKNKHQMPAVVSSDWLSGKLECRTIRIIDVRSEEEYQSSHIPNSVNIPFIVPFSTWITMKDGLLLEVPELPELAAALGNKGVSSDNHVVLITSLPTPENPYSLASPTRAALTLAYTGMNNISILDGGFETWVSDGKPVTTEPDATTPVTFDYDDHTDFFVTMDYVKANLGKVILIDARDAAVYSGAVIEPFADKAGHIPTAVSLPAPSLWNDDGTYKSTDAIRAIAENIIGKKSKAEIVVYCGVGGYASTVWFALTQILDYKNVKVYDGSAQEWVLSNDMEL